MKADKLWLFLRFTPDGNGPALLEEMGQESFQECVTDAITFRMADEGFPLQEEMQTVIVMPEEWASEADYRTDTPAATLLSSVNWYFKSKGSERKVVPYASFGTAEKPGKARLFWLGYPAVSVLPVIAFAQAESDCSETQHNASRASGNQEVAPEKPQTDSVTEAAAEMFEKTEPLKPWQDVYVFISSTFNDMHAERNYLVKRVFPRLSQWCAQYRLRLRDIDLRWGITEEDSTVNRRTVQICLENIDKCRPFFLCFVGQRRGWVPSGKDIAEETFRCFPKLEGNLGHSVTEMEVIHSLIDPMHNGHILQQDKITRAFFYLRDPGYLEKIKKPALQQVYTNIGSDDPQKEDALLTDFREKILPGTNRPCRTYTCSWDENGVTSELGAVHGASSDITKGTLTDFICGSEALADRILQDMKEAISERFGLKESLGLQSGLQRELDVQQQFLQQTAEAFIERPGDTQPLDEYLRVDSRAPLILTGGAGSGKTSLLAHWIVSTGYHVCCRFVGRGLTANTPAELAYSVWEQLYHEGRVSSTPPDNTGYLMEHFGDLLAQAGNGQGIILVIDAIDQFPGGVWDATFLPHQLAPGVKLIISVREDAQDAENYLLDASSYARIIRVRPFDGLHDREALAEAFLKNYLKQLDGDQMKALISSPGAENPLYLKIVLNELRLFGEYNTLTRHISEDFGDSVHSAFDAMLSRLEHDADCERIPMRLLVPKVFGYLAHCRNGLSAYALAELLLRAGVATDTETLHGAVLLLQRQLRPFLTEREQRIDFFYDSFREVCTARYTVCEKSENWHREIAQYLKTRPENDLLRLSEMAWQYYMAKDEQAYLACVFDYTYLSEKRKAFGNQAVISDYSLSSDRDTQRMVSLFGLSGKILSEHPDQLVTRLYGHLQGLQSPNIERLLSSACRAQTSRWLMPLNRCFETPDADGARNLESDKELSGVVLLQNDRLVASIADGKSIWIWDLDSNNIRTRLFIPEEGFCFCGLYAAAGGSRLVAYLMRSFGVNREAIINVYETHGFSLLRSFSVGSFGPSYRHYSDSYFKYPQPAFSDDGKVMFIMDEKGKLHAYSLLNGQVMGYAEDRWSINKLCFAGDGLVAAAHIHPQNDHPKYFLESFERAANPVYLFRFNTATEQLGLHCKIGEWKSTVNAIGLSADGNYLAGADDDSVLVYDIRDGKQVVRLHEKRVSVIRFLPKRKLLLTVGERVAVYAEPDFTLIRYTNGLGYINDATVLQDEIKVALNIAGKKRIRFWSVDVSEKEEQNNTAPEGIRSICKANDGKSIWASAYSNWIAHDKEAVPGADTRPRLFLFSHDGSYLGRKALPARDYQDYVYLSSDGSAAVSKNFQDSNQYIFRYWNLEDASDPDSEIPLPDTWLFPRSQSRLLIKNPRDILFSADRRFAMLVDENTKEISVYKAKTGRKLGTVKITQSGKGFRGLLHKNSDESVMQSFYADASEDGSELYLLFAFSANPRIDRYSIKTGKPIATVYLSDKAKSYSGLNYENPLCQLIADRHLLAFANQAELLLIDTQTGNIRARIDREQAGCQCEDYFAAVSPDGRFAALSDRRVYTDGNWKLQLWDLAENTCLGEFVADGHISEIIYEPEKDTWLFGMESGKLCRLKAEGKAN